jgi:hypothetical protein
LSTQEEVALYNQLLPKHTKTSFDEMARDFNNNVVMQLRQPQLTGCEGNYLACKTARQLRTFDRTVAKEICKRDAMGVMEAITGTAQLTAPLPLGVQQVVDTLSLLMAAARQKDSKSSKSGVEMLLVLLLPFWKGQGLCFKGQGE